MRQVRKFNSIDERDAAYVANPNIDTLSYVSEGGSVRRRRAEDSLGEMSVEIRQLTVTDGPAKLDETIEVEFVVTNTGIVNLENLALVSEKTEDNWPVSSLAIAGTLSRTAYVTIDEFDILNGCIVDFTVSATATVGPDPQPVTKTLRIATDEPNPHVSVDADYSISSGDEYVRLGERVDITVTVTNDGNVTLGDVLVECERTGFEDHAYNIQPNESSEFIDTISITEADILNYGAEIEYIPNASQVGGFDVDGMSANMIIPTEDPSGHLTCDIIPLTELGNGDSHVGDIINLQASVTNSGNLTITDVTVNIEACEFEDHLESIAIGQSFSWPISYTVTEDDVLAWQGVIVMTANGTSPDPYYPDVPVEPGEFIFSAS